MFARRFLTSAVILFTLAALTTLACRVPMLALGPTPTPLPTNTPVPTSTPLPTNTPAATNTPVPTSTPAPTATPTATPSGPFVYSIQSGETLDDIAQRYGVDLATLLALNPGLDPNTIVVGQQILIPGSGTSAGATTGETPDGWTRYDQVEDGFSIALPEGWVPWDMESEQIRELMDATLEQYPELAAQMDETTAQMTASGAKFIGLDLGGYDVSTGFMTNLSVMVQYVGPGLDVDMFAAIYEAQLESMDFVTSEITSEFFDLPAGECLLVTYETDMMGAVFSLYQFILIENSNGYILTMTTTIDEAAALDQDFRDIAGSFIITQ